MAAKISRHVFQDYFNQPLQSGNLFTNKEAMLFASILIKSLVSDPIIRDGLSRLQSPRAQFPIYQELHSPFKGVRIIWISNPLLYPPIHQRTYNVFDNIYTREPRARFTDQAFRSNGKQKQESPNFSQSSERAKAEPRPGFTDRASQSRGNQKRESTRDYSQSSNRAKTDKPASEPAQASVNDSKPEVLNFYRSKVPGAQIGNDYSLLGLTPSATVEEIKKQYRKLLLLLHPDKNNGSEVSTEAFKLLHEAFNRIKIARNIP